MAPGRVLISFDLELGWGQSGRLSRRELERVRRARELLPRLVEVVEARGLAVTWATTLALGHLDADDALQFAADNAGPSALPELFPEVAELRRFPEAYFFPELVRGLARRSIQDRKPGPAEPGPVEAGPAEPGKTEVGCHTYRHPIWNDATPPDLELEFRLSRQMASRLGCTLETLVFPRNRYSSRALAAARAAGFLGFRRDEFVSNSERRSGLHVALGRAERFLDAFGLARPVRSGATRPGVTSEGGLCSVAGQRFLRLDDPNWMRQVHLSHVRRELRSALQRGETFHLWSHPENFARSPSGALLAFAALLDEIGELKEQGSAVSETMAQVCHAYRARLPLR